MSFTDETTKLLAAPLDPKSIVKPNGSAFGPKGDYLEGWHVIAELNRIFGFGGWSYTIELRQDALAKADGKDQWQAAYTCICTLTVGAVTRQDVGFGSGFAKNVGDAIEGATKEAATDALKRAARTFGSQFGLALYDKSRANVAAPEPEPEQFISDDDRALIMTLAPAAEVSIQTICEGYNISDLRDLPAKKVPALIKRLQGQPETRKAA